MIAEIGNILTTIASMQNAFTKSEKKIAELLLSDPQIITYGIISEVAARAGVGDTTVVRFCNKLGYKGYYDFRIALAQEVFSMPSVAAAGDGEQSATIVGRMRRQIQQIVQSLESTVSMASEDTLRAAADLLEKASRIFFYGIGFSGITCQYGKQKYLRGGLSCDTFTEGHLMSINSALLNPTDLVIAISFSGSTIDMVEGLRIAKEQRASVIAITHYLKSPITTYADVVLISGAKESALESGTYTTFVTQSFIVDALYQEYFRRHPDKLNSTFIKSLKAVWDKVQ